MKTKTTGSANDANTWRAGATCSTTARIGPRIAVIASGSDSHTQSTTTAARMAARRCAGAARPSGAASSATNTAGARKNPAVRRMRSTRASTSETRSTGGAGARSMGAAIFFDRRVGDKRIEPA